jgi:hypothetical protein
VNGAWAEPSAGGTCRSNKPRAATTPSITHPYADPKRTYLEGVFDAICWTRGQFLDPPSGY